MVRVIDISGKTDPNVHGGRMPSGPRGILLHHTGSSNEAGDIAWLSQWHPNPVSVQKVVLRDGTIVKLVADNVVAWHAGDSTMHGLANCNLFCIGYELANNGRGEKYPAAQFEAVCQSVAYDTALYKIPDSWVSTHALVALPPGRKTDPLGWDMARMWERVAQIRADWPYAPHVPVWSAP